MRPAFEFSKKVAQVGWQYIVTTRQSRQSVDLFKDVETYCLFVGYPRSGHSIIGALLDAHPNAIFAHELADLKYIRAGFDKWRLFNLLLQNSRNRAQRNPKNGFYFYGVPDQWQGRFKKLKVIGDKHGGGATLRIKAWPRILNILQKKVQVPVKIIHVYRNPFDNVTTMTTKATRKEKREPDLNLQIDKYFSLCETILTIKKEYRQFEMIDIKQEAFIREPSQTLRQLCEFLNLQPNDGYLNACTSIVYDRPNKSRSNLDWSKAMRQKVETRMTEFPYLKDYSFDD